MRGFSYEINCEAHIWCWPTPAVKIVSGPEIFPNLSITYCGESAPSLGMSYPSGKVERQELTCLIQAVKSGRAFAY